MAPSPRRSSRKDANALPSMSSTFWAIMILASLLIAYCTRVIFNQLHNINTVNAHTSVECKLYLGIVAPSYGGRETCIKSIRLVAIVINIMQYSPTEEKWSDLPKLRQLTLVFKSPPPLASSALPT
ncbi:protein fam19a5 isoform x1 [Limosa lapponica baueri]|uniref:Protein fam19a5 isoform x1 n=1 Tax=Limosa lapponica baueri TaxID=1758121 RepID=A0A2I0UGD8_LIMLA|nr:protein fam19a5 isoform x1 [Limosa lapponica baueri]